MPKKNKNINDLFDKEVTRKTFLKGSAKFSAMALLVNKGLLPNLYANSIEQEKEQDYFIASGHLQDLLTLSPPHHFETDYDVIKGLVPQKLTSFNSFNPNHIAVLESHNNQLLYMSDSDQRLASEHVDNLIKTSGEPTLVRYLQTDKSDQAEIHLTRGLGVGKKSEVVSLNLPYSDQTKILAMNGKLHNQPKSDNPEDGTHNEQLILIYQPVKVSTKDNWIEYFDEKYDSGFGGYTNTLTLVYYSTDAEQWVHLFDDKINKTRNSILYDFKDTINEKILTNSSYQRLGKDNYVGVEQAKVYSNADAGQYILGSVRLNYFYSLGFYVSFKDQKPTVKWICTATNQQNSLLQLLPNDQVKQKLINIHHPVFYPKYFMLETGDRDVCAYTLYNHSDDEGKDILDPKSTIKPLCKYKIAVMGLENTFNRPIHMPEFNPNGLQANSERTGLFQYSVRVKDKTQIYIRQPDFNIYKKRHVLFNEWNDSFNESSPHYKNIQNITSLLSAEDINKLKQNDSTDSEIFTSLLIGLLDYGYSSKSNYYNETSLTGIFDLRYLLGVVTQSLNKIEIKLKYLIDQDDELVEDSDDIEIIMNQFEYHFGPDGANDEESSIVNSLLQKENVSPSQYEDFHINVSLDGSLNVLALYNGSLYFAENASNTNEVNETPNLMLTKVCNPLPKSLLILPFQNTTLLRSVISVGISSQNDKGEDIYKVIYSQYDGANWMHQELESVVNTEQATGNGVKVYKPYFYFNLKVLSQEGKPTDIGEHEYIEVRTDQTAYIQDMYSDTTHHSNRYKTILLKPFKGELNCRIFPIEDSCCMDGVNLLYRIVDKKQYVQKTKKAICVNLASNEMDAYIWQQDNLSEKVQNRFNQYDKKPNPNSKFTPREVMEACINPEQADTDAANAYRQTYEAYSEGILKSASQFSSKNDLKLVKGNINTAQINPLYIHSNRVTLLGECGLTKDLFNYVINAAKSLYNATDSLIHHNYSEFIKNLKSLGKDAIKVFRTLKLPITAITGYVNAGLDDLHLGFLKIPDPLDDLLDLLELLLDSDEAWEIGKAVRTKANLTDKIKTYQNQKDSFKQEIAIQTINVKDTISQTYNDFVENISKNLPDKQTDIGDKILSVTDLFSTNILGSIYSIFDDIDLGFSFNDLPFTVKGKTPLNKNVSNTVADLYDQLESIMDFESYVKNMQATMEKLNKDLLNIDAWSLFEDILNTMSSPLIKATNNLEDILDILLFDFNESDWSKMTGAPITDLIPGKIKISDVVSALGLTDLFKSVLPKLDDLITLLIGYAVMGFAKHYGIDDIKEKINRSNPKAQNLMLNSNADTSEDAQFILNACVAGLGEIAIIMDQAEQTNISGLFGVSAEICSLTSMVIEGNSTDESETIVNLSLAIEATLSVLKIGGIAYSVKNNKSVTALEILDIIGSLIVLLILICGMVAGKVEMSDLVHNLVFILPDFLGIPTLVFDHKKNKEGVLYTSLIAFAIELTFVVLDYEDIL